MKAKEIGCGLLILAAFVCLVAGLAFTSKEDEKRCLSFLAYAHTARDTMEVLLRCEALRVERERTTAISLSGSAAAASSSSSSYPPR